MAEVTDLNRGFGLQDGYDQWKQDIAAYKKEKTEFQGVPPVYKKVTNAFVKAQDAVYNPITQTYNDKQKESHVQQIEQQTKVDVLAGNKDKALRYEQTYNILNFENKLKGLEHRPNYPKEKPWYFRPGKDTSTDYNMISNIATTEHHFAEPDKRPGPGPEAKERGKRTQKRNLREYNVISNRYLELHDLKVQANDDVQRAEAAKTFWRLNEYDPIQTKYYDQEKEQDFIQKRDEESKNHGKDEVKKLPAEVQNNGLMYNPVNNNIEDEDRLKERDQREKNKKQRYEVRYDAEIATRKETLAEYDRQERLRLGRVSHKRVKEEEDRGFDILTNGGLQGGLTQFHNTDFMQKPKGVWDKIAQTNEDEGIPISQGLLAQHKAQSSQVAAAEVSEFSKTSFVDRSKRITGTKNLCQNATGSAAPSSNHSRKPASQAASSTASRRQVRTGGFQKLGQEIASK